VLISDVWERHSKEENIIMHLWRKEGAQKDETS
jgi:hypothetical protein